MKKVKVFIEMSSYGYSAYMDDTPLNYSCLGEGKTVEEAIQDFHKAYAEMKDYFQAAGKPFEDIQYEFFYDVGSFLEEYAKVFSLSGLERITGVNQTQLGHYLHGRSRPSKKTVEKIQKGVQEFAHNLIAVRFA